MIGEAYEHHENMEEADEDVVRTVGLSIIKPAAKMRVEGFNFIAEISIPGVKRDDISVSLKRNRLSVYADKSEADSRYFKSSGLSTCFKFSEFLPVSVVPEKADVRYGNGTLRITAPIEEEGGEPLFTPMG
jgi:HSP20 family molecular chaperone IbpA